MALSDVALRKAKAAEKPYRITDGDGLYVIIRPNGAKWWRFDYRINGKRKTMSFGTYPEISLADARARREAARKLVANGSDPVEKERQERRDKTAEAENTFGAIAEEYIERLRSMGRAPGTITQAEWHLRKLAAKLSDEPIREITSAKILDVLKHIESSGRIETAHKVRSSIGSVFRLAISTLRAENDPTVALRGAIRPRVDEPRAAITNEREFGGLLQSVDEYDGWVTLRAALQIIALCYPRPGELRHAEWRHFDFSRRVWTVPEHLTKMRRPHDIPLSHQAVTILKGLAKFSSESELVFPSIRNLKRPLSENAMNSALRRMGYQQDEHCAHGFRSSASTILNGRGFRYDVIERSLAHLDPNKVRRTYNRYEYWDERVELAQAWADICDELKNRKRRRYDDLI